MNKKYIAFYLPQFHEIEENNIWWGKGFTEWTNCRKSKPLFSQHNQPRIPEKNHYYDITEKDVLRWQAQLANNHGITGFCLYHYWFKGKKLLEKPAELLLGDEFVDIDFCFSWANETWSRTWNGTDKDILIKQDYGDYEDWIEHINYLMPFFKDRRYIKKDGRPYFIIYNIHKIPRLEEMIECWNQQLKNNGIPNIFIVQTLNSFNHGISSKYISESIEFEPWYTISRDKSLRLRLKCKRYVRRLFNDPFSIPKFLHSTVSFDEINEQILKRTRGQKGNVNAGAFPGWDNSPRKARIKNSTIIEGETPFKFKLFLKELQKAASNNSSEYIFINAWNEWGESAYLEPDNLYGSSYLNAVYQSLEND